MRGWPSEDEVVQGRFFAGGDAAVEIPFTVTVHEATGAIPPPPGGITDRYIRDYTVTTSFDCADFPKAGCEGKYALELHERLTGRSITPGGL